MGKGQVACPKNNTCVCTLILGFFTQGVLGLAGWGCLGDTGREGVVGGRIRISFSGDMSHSLLYRTTAVYLRGECLWIVSFYSSLQTLECPLRRERFELGSKLWAEFQVSSKNSQSYFCPLLAGQNSWNSGFSLLRAPPTPVVSPCCLNSPALSQDMDKTRSFSYGKTSSSHPDPQQLLTRETKYLYFKASM